MAGGSWLIDPKTGDYVMVGGAPVVDQTLRTPAYFRIKPARKQWLYAPDDSWGSDIYLYKNKALHGSPTAIAAAGQRALNPMIQDQRALLAQVSVTKAVRGAVALEADIVDASGQQQKLVLNPIGV